MGTKILLVDDEDVIQIGLSKYLGKLGYSVSKAYTLKQARQLIETEIFDTILLDVKLPDGISLDLIQEINSSGEDVPIVVISGVSDIQTAVKSIQAGAANFITKSVEIEALGLSIQKCLEHTKLKKQEARSKRLNMSPVQPYIGNSTQGKQVGKFAEVAARNDSVVLLLGETGTGKGVIARWIHEHSDRSSGNYVELNCSALKGELLRSELYGHARGSFTSAVKDREGLIEVADHGTLFLDEIGDMDLSVQAELLKTIEEKKFRRIGENKLRTSNFRLICATNKNLLQGAENGKFRTDLYYRICVFPIELPALSARKKDIPGFLKNFLISFGYENLPLGPELLRKLINYSWPGNIREMRNVIERAILLSQGNKLTLEHFPGITETPETIDESEDIYTLSEVERKHILKIMDLFNDDLTEASKVLGISIDALKSKLNNFDYVAVT